MLGDADTAEHCDTVVARRYDTQVMLQMRYPNSRLGYLSNSSLCDVDLALDTIDILVHHSEHLILHL